MKVRGSCRGAVGPLPCRRDTTLPPRAAPSTCCAADDAPAWPLWKAAALPSCPGLLSRCQRPSAALRGACMPSWRGFAAPAPLAQATIGCPAAVRSACTADAPTPPPPPHPTPQTNPPTTTTTTHPTTHPHPCRAMQGLVGVLDAAEAACGRRDQLPQLLEGCIAASLEAAFDAALEQLSANVTVGEASRLLWRWRAALHFGPPAPPDGADGPGLCRALCGSSIARAGCCLGSTDPLPSVFLFFKTWRPRTAWLVCSLHRPPGLCAPSRRGPVDAAGGSHAQRELITSWFF